jgi:hypothetical protein
MHTDRCGNTGRQKCYAKGSGRKLKYNSLGIDIQRMWIKGAVCDHRSAHFAGECVLLKPEEHHLFLPNPMHACPRHGPWATSSDG